MALWRRFTAEAQRTPRTYLRVVRVNLADFCQLMHEMSALDPPERHARMTVLHGEFTEGYLPAFGRIDAEEAGRPVQIGEERRMLAQVVGHITEWERFIIMGAGDILAGVEHPRMVTGISGYREPDGTEVHFERIDDFNHYQAEKHRTWAWESLQVQAIETAGTLRTLFTHPDLITWRKLERTKSWRKRLPDGTLIPDLRMGWCLWITLLEHQGVEHAQELRMESARPHS
jgi:hypothetical protein